MVISAVLAVEALAGGVWFRQSWRREIWPAVLVILGWGMVAVALIDPNDRAIHVLIGFMMLTAGIAERRYRYGQMSLQQANLFLVPALIAGGLEIGVFHSHGGMTSHGFLTHAAYGTTATMLAPIRLYQSRAPQSAGRSALMAAGVFVLALQLLALNHGDNIDLHSSEPSAESPADDDA